MPRAVWPLVVLVVAVVAGGLVGLVVGSLSLAAASDDNGWAELGAYIVGALAALVGFGVAYVVGLVLAGRRAFPPGRRALPVSLALGIPVAIGLLVGVLGEVASQLDADLTPALGLVAGVAVLSAAPLAFAWGDTAAGQRRLFIAAAAMAALVVAVASAGIGADRVRTSRVVASLPLMLFDGQSADAPFQGWRRDEFSTVWVTENRRSFTDQGHSAYLKYLTPGGVVG